LPGLVMDDGGEVTAGTPPCAPRDDGGPSRRGASLRCGCFGFDIIRP